MSQIGALSLLVVVMGAIVTLGFTGVHRWRRSNDSKS